MRIRPLLTAILLGLAAIAPSHAATYLMFNGSSGVFGNDLTASPTFTDTFDLGQFAPGAYLFSGTISSSYQGQAGNAQDIDFTSVSLNGHDFSISSTGQFELRYVADVPSGTSNLLKVQGTAGSSSTYSGTFNVASVPEASTWALMLGGFGMVGYALRGSRRSRAAPGGFRTC